MDEDDLEPIDLSEDAPVREPRRRPRPHRVSRRAALGSIAIVGAVLAAVAAVSQSSGGEHSSTSRAPGPPSTAAAHRRPPPGRPPAWVVPSGLSDVARGPFVAIVDWTPILVSPTGQIRRVLADLPGRALLGAAQRGAVLVGYPRSTTRVIDADLGPRPSGRYDPLPAGIELIPDANGRWWSNFGQLEGGPELRIVRVPAGTRPIAHLADGYLVTDTRRAGLLQWTGSTRLPIIALGRARVLALDHNLVAWSDDEGRVAHVFNFDTRRVVDIACGEYARTARFSPDRSRLAILRSAAEDSMVLADTTSGRVLARSVFTHDGAGGLTDIAGPPAFQPAPFSFDARGHLALVATTTTGTEVRTFDREGTVIRTVAAPARLQQVVFLVS